MPDDRDPEDGRDVAAERRRTEELTAVPETPDLDTLIRDLEGASEGSRELDRHVYWVLALPRHGDMEAVIPHYTTSLDAALSLVPEGMVWSMENWPTSGTGAKVFNCGKPYRVGMTYSQRSPALAFCIAALKARAHD